VKSNKNVSRYDESANNIFLAMIGYNTLIMCSVSTALRYQLRSKEGLHLSKCKFLMQKRAEIFCRYDFLLLLCSCQTRKNFYQHYVS